MVCPGEGGVINVLQTMRFIATREMGGAVLLMTTKMLSLETVMTGCLPHAKVTKVFLISRIP